MARPLLRMLIIVPIAVIVATQSAEAQGNWRPGDFGAIRFRLGLFEPEANSQYWDDKFHDFTGSASDLEDLIWGADYIWRTSQRSGVLFGTSFFNGDMTQAYRDYVDESGNDIRHTTALELYDFYAGYTYRFGNRSWRVVPYAGAGAGLLYWKLRESGYFIDFADPGLPVFWGDYRADGWTWEGFALAGLDVPLSFRWSFFFEGRYRWSEAELGNDFSGLGTIDLSGPELTAGFSWNF